MMNRFQSMFKTRVRKIQVPEESSTPETPMTVARVLRLPLLTFTATGQLALAETSRAKAVCLGFWMTVVRLASLLRFVPALVNYRQFSIVQLILILCVQSFLFCISIALLAANRHLKTFLDSLDKHYLSQSHPLYLRRLRKIINVALVAAYLQSFILLLCMVLTQRNESVVKLLLYPYGHVGEMGNILIAVTVSCVHFTNLVHHFTSLIIFTAVWYCLHRELKELDSEIITCIQSGSEAVSRDLERLRQRHESLCELVQAGDSALASTTISIALFVPIFCATVLGLARETYSFDYLFLTVFFTISEVLKCGFVVFLGVLLNSKIHKPRDYLLKIKMENLSEKTLHIISLFMARVNGPSLGFTVYGLFTIDMSAVLTLVGTLCAYVIVVLQLSVGGAAGPSVQSVSEPTLNWTTTVSP